MAVVLSCVVTVLLLVLCRLNRLLLSCLRPLTARLALGVGLIARIPAFVPALLAEVLAAVFREVLGRNHVDAADLARFERAAGDGQLDRSLAQAQHLGRLGGRQPSFFDRHSGLSFVAGRRRGWPAPPAKRRGRTYIVCSLAGSARAPVPQDRPH